MTRTSAPDLLVLHAVRLLGFADASAVADRAGLSEEEATRLLAAATSAGWVRTVAFADLAGCTLTEAGMAENESRLAAERRAADPQGIVAASHRRFLPLNARLLRAVTDWQIRPRDSDPFAPNDHEDDAWDARILAELAALGRTLTPLIDDLAGVLARFAGYDVRFRSALERAVSGESAWVDATGVDSCHRVWFELHEDLIATLGADRRSEGAGDPGPG